MFTVEEITLLLCVTEHASPSFCYFVSHEGLASMISLCFYFEG